MRTNFYGPMGTQSIIRQADAVIFDMNSGIADSDQRIQTIRIEPNPINISADSDYGFTETYYGALDSA